MYQRNSMKINIKILIWIDVRFFIIWMESLASHCTSSFDKSIKVLQEQKAISILSTKKITWSCHFFPQITQHTYNLNSSLLLSRWSFFPLACLKRNIMLRVWFHGQLKPQRHTWHKVLSLCHLGTEAASTPPCVYSRRVLVQTHWSNWKLTLPKTSLWADPIHNWKKGHQYADGVG